MRFLVTLKLPKHPLHDPANKVTGPCPLQPWSADDTDTKLCTDVTGQHHTILVERDSLEELRSAYERTYHVTRIEEV